MSVNQNKPRVQFTNEDMAEGTERQLELEYRQPFTDEEVTSRTKEQKCIGAPSVIQHLGADADALTYTGHCYPDEWQFLKMLPHASRVTIRSDAYRGPAVITHASKAATGGSGGVRADLSEDVLNYRITALRVVDAPFADGENQGGGEGGST